MKTFKGHMLIEMYVDANSEKEAVTKIDKFSTYIKDQALITPTFPVIFVQVTNLSEFENK